MRTKYQAALASNRKLESEVAAARARVTALTTENEGLVAQVRALEGRVEVAIDVARKATAEGARVRAEEEAKRTAMVDRMAEVSASLDDKLTKFSAESSAVAAQNDDLRTKLTRALEAADLQQRQFDATARALGLEKQLAEAKLKQAEAITAAAEKMAGELSAALEASRKREGSLGEALDVYRTKFAEVDTLVADMKGSTAAHKKERDALSKSLRESEGERIAVLKRALASENERVALTVRLTDALRDAETQRGMAVKLQGLCRTLQSERSALLAQLAAASGGGSAATGTTTLAPAAASEAGGEACASSDAPTATPSPPADADSLPPAPDSSAPMPPPAASAVPA